MGDERERPDEPPRQSLAPEAESGAASPHAGGPGFEIPAVLELEDPRAILIRLSEEDPFELCTRTPRRCQERAVLLPNARLAMMATARMAIAAKSYTGERPIEQWVEHALDLSIDDMLAEQREEERRGLPVPESQDSAFYAELAELFGCPVLDARMACTTLNAMSEEHRQAFHAVVVRGLSPARWAEESRATRPRVEELLREVGGEVQARLLRRHKARRKNRRR